MTITPDGWFDWAERLPGPPSKVWPDTNSMQGVVFHSAVGSLQGVINIVLGPATNNRSVTGVVGYDGRFVQFYPVTASPWANGSHDANRRFLGFEHEGGRDTPATVSEPLTEAQVAVDVRILNDLTPFIGAPGPEYWQRPVSPQDTSASLWEHREMTRFGGSPTACPSGRIPWEVIKASLAPSPPLRLFLWGDQFAGVEQRGAQLVEWHGNVPTWLHGDEAGAFPGRIAKLFGENYWWLRKDPSGFAFWSPTEGD